MDPSISPPLPTRVNSADEQIEDSTMYVITRTGKREPLDTNQITRRFQTLLNRKPKIQHINPYELMLSVCNGLKSDISTYEIDEYAAGAASSMSISNPNYLKMAARIAIDNHQKNTIRSFVDKMRKAYLNEQNGKINSLIGSDFFKYVEEHQDFIEKTIDYGRDFLLDFFGFRTFQNQYSIKVQGKPIERPQDMFMRTAVDLNMNTTDSIEQELQNIKETYDLLSNKFYTHASPTYFNAGGKYNQYASCFLLGTEDSRAGIIKTVDDISEISKWAGGIGIHTNEYRGTGALIRSTNGKAGGLLPWYRIFEATLQAFNQGGRRPGRGAMYIMPHHPDIELFCELARNTGENNRRVRDLFYAVWLPDIFMERVRKGEIWSLFDPDRTINLSDYTGVEYTSKYLDLENKKQYTKQLPARDIWKAIYDTNKEVGMPYICFADTVNRLSMQKNIGVIKSSNLCVSPDTLILTDIGYYDIKTLSETNRGRHKVWNATEFVEAQFAKTGSDKELLKITFSDGVELKCTPNHRFAMFAGYKSDKYMITRAKDLQIDDKLMKCDFPVIENGTNDFLYPYTHGFYCGDGTNEILKRINVRCPWNAVEDKCYCKHHEKANLPELTPLYSGKCRATTLKIVKYIDLYGEKKKLLQYMEHVSYTENKEHDRYRLTLKKDTASKFTIPKYCNLQTKLEWLAGYLDADGTIAKNGDAWSIQVSSINKEFLMGVKLLCNTLGTNPLIQVMHEQRQTMLPDGKGGKKLYNCQICYKLCFSVADTAQLYELGLNTHRLTWNNHEIPMSSKKQYIRVIKIEKVEEKSDTYCFNEPDNHMGIFNGVIAMNCSEIVLYSNSKEYAVCILSSIALNNFVQDTYTDEEMAQPEESRRILDHEFPLNPYFNFTQLIKVTKTVVRNLNYIVDKTFQPVVETKRSNARHRPIGIGVQGLDDAYAKMRFPFSSDEAADLNKKIFETLYYAAVSQSAMLAREDYIKLKKSAQTNGSVTVKTYVPEHYDDVFMTYTAETLPKTAGAYPSMLWNGGSPISKGIFHWELAGLTPDKLSGMYDWESLRELVKQFGVKNSQLLAIPPTASTSQLLGNNECVEPYTSNIYTRETQAGKYVVVKKYLMNDLYKLGIWGPNIKDYLIATEGSIQHIEGIPDDIKRLYPTVYEIDQMHIIRQAAARQPFIDQAQSINLYSTNMSMTEWNKLLFAAFDLGSKTGKYYLHSKEAVPAQKFTLDPSKQAEMRQMLEKIKHRPARLEKLKDVCDSCSS